MPKLDYSVNEIKKDFPIWVPIHYYQDSKTATAIHITHPGYELADFENFHKAGYKHPLYIGPKDIVLATKDLDLTAETRVSMLDWNNGEKHTNIVDTKGRNTNIMMHVTAITPAVRKYAVIKTTDEDFWSGTVDTMKAAVRGLTNLVFTQSEIPTGKNTWEDYGRFIILSDQPGEISMGLISVLLYNQGMGVYGLGTLIGGIEGEPSYDYNLININAVVEEESEEDQVWNSIDGEYEDLPEDMERFLDAIETVCIEHNMSISHEDEHGAFKIERYSNKNLDWLKKAHKHYE